MQENLPSRFSYFDKAIALLSKKLHDDIHATRPDLSDLHHTEHRHEYIHASLGIEQLFSNDRVLDPLELYSLPSLIHTDTIDWPDSLAPLIENSSRGENIHLLKAINHIGIQVEHRVILWDYWSTEGLKIIDVHHKVCNMFVFRSPFELPGSFITHVLLLLQPQTCLFYGIDHTASTKDPFQPPDQLWKPLGNVSTKIPIQLSVRCKSYINIQKLVQHESTKRVFVISQNGELNELVFETEPDAEGLQVFMESPNSFFSRTNFFLRWTGKILSKFHRAYHSSALALDFSVDQYRNLLYVLLKNDLFSVYSLGRKECHEFRLICSGNHIWKMKTWSEIFSLHEEKKSYPIVSLFSGHPCEKFHFVALASNGDRFFYVLHENLLTGRKKIILQKRFFAPLKEGKQYLTSCPQIEPRSSFMKEGFTVITYTSKFKDTSSSRISSTRTKNSENDQTFFSTIPFPVPPGSHFEKRYKKVFETLSSFSREKNVLDSFVLSIVEIEDFKKQLPSKNVKNDTFFTGTVAQSLFPPRRFAIFTRKKIYFLRKIRPIDTLYVILTVGPTQVTRSFLSFFEDTIPSEDMCALLALLSTASVGVNEFDDISRLLWEEKLKYPAASHIRLLDIIDVENIATEMLESQFISEKKTIPRSERWKNSSHSFFDFQRDALVSRIPRSKSALGMQSLLVSILRTFVSFYLFEPQVHDPRNNRTILMPKDVMSLLTYFDSFSRIIEKLRSRGWLEYKRLKGITWVSIEGDELTVRASQHISNLTLDHAVSLQAMELNSMDYISSMTTEFLIFLQSFQKLGISSELHHTCSRDYEENRIFFEKKYGLPLDSSFDRLTFDHVLFSGLEPLRFLVRSLWRTTTHVPWFRRPQLEDFYLFFSSRCRLLASEQDDQEYRARMLLREYLPKPHGTKKNLDLSVMEEFNRFFSPLARHLWETCGLKSICCLLRDINCWITVARLCLSAAQQSDPKCDGLMAYINSKKPNFVHMASESSERSFQIRWQCYSLFTSLLDFKFGPKSNQIYIDLFDPHRPRSTNIWHLEACDELAKYYLFEWMLTTTRPPRLREFFLDVVCNLNSPHVLTFLNLHKVELGHELAVYFARNFFFSDALEAYLCAITRKNISHPNPLDYRLALLAEALSLATSKGLNHHPTFPRFIVSRTVLKMQYELLKICEHCETNLTYLSRGLVEADGQRYPVRIFLKLNQRRLRCELFDRIEDVYELAAFFKGYGGEFVQIMALYSTGAKDSTTQVLIGELIKTLFETSSNLEATVKGLFNEVYEPMEEGKISMNLLLHLLSNIPNLEIRRFCNVFLTLIEEKNDFRTFFEELVGLYDSMNSQREARFSQVHINLLLLLCDLVHRWKGLERLRVDTGLVSRSEYNVLSARSTCEMRIREALASSISPQSETLKSSLALLKSLKGE